MKLPRRLIKILLVSAGLILLFAVTAFGTTCASISNEEALRLARESQSEYFDKGLYIGLSLATYIGILIRCIGRHRWIALTVAVGLVPVLPIAYLVTEMSTPSCYTPGVRASTYIYGLALLVVVLVADLLYTSLANRKTVDRIP